MNNDSFSWLDSIIVKHKANCVSNESIEQVIKENLDYKCRYNYINEIIAERDKLKELNVLKEKQIELLEKKVETLTKAISDEDIISRIKDDINQLYMKVGNMVQSMIEGTIDIDIKDEHMRSRQYCYEIAKERLCHIDSMVSFIYEQNNKYKNVIKEMEENYKRNIIVEKEAHYVNVNENEEQNMNDDNPGQIQQGKNEESKNIMNKGNMKNKRKVSKKK